MVGNEQSSPAKDPAGLFRLDGRVALVTGSTTGIGREIARGFAAVGARVWVHGRNTEGGRHLAQELGGHFIPADLARPEGVQSMVDELRAVESRLDVLVNNAGIEIGMPIDEFDMAAFDLTWRVNVRAAVEVTHRLLPLLEAANEASIINVTSIHETVPYPRNAAYAMSKAALSMFTRTVAVELAPRRIRINNLAPGAVETDLNRHVLDRIGRERFAEWIPVGRVARATEMVGPALFLASAASRYVTGATLYADGGYVQHLVRYRLEEDHDG